MPNRLVNETSPYLLQHAHNPVDWFPWGAEALEKAKAEDRPILLSIGYSACHWCHVMERESFESEAVAEVMNTHFINIKVDREERPDLDELYMKAVQAFSGGHGGWPMTVFLTPEGHPFFGGTYFPPAPRGGIPSFGQVLQHVHQLYHRDRPRVTEITGELLTYLSDAVRMPTPAPELSDRWLEAIAAAADRDFDSKNGGFGDAPKFPAYGTLAGLLARTNDRSALKMATATLSAMAQGGMYDLLAGGFARYSVDDAWRVPHFEKMLYDNGQLVPLYLTAFQRTGQAHYARIAAETLDYVLREMTLDSGGFAASQDADSEGVEGKFYAWTPAQIREAVGIVDGLRVSMLLEVTDDGTFEHGTSVLRLTTPLEELEAADRELLIRCLPLLKQARDRRVAPGRDDKIICAWNAMMIGAMARGAFVLDAPKYAEAAGRAADCLLARLRPDGRLLRTDGATRLLAYADDYALLIDALINLYEATFERRWLTEALALSDQLIALFWDTDEGGFFYTGTDAETLVARSKHLIGGAEPAANEIAALAFCRLEALCGRADLGEKADHIIRAYQLLLDRAPRALSASALAGAWRSGKGQEIAIVGAADDPTVAEFLAVLRSSPHPFRVVACLSPADLAAGAPAELPWLEGRSALDGKATAYLCEHFTCLAPTTDPEVLRQQLTAAKPTKAVGPARVHAPALPEDPEAWIGTPVSLEALKGSVVVLDFWTHCCINCQHILPELAAVEAEFSGKPVAVIGVHSAKFPAEEARESVEAAVARHDIRHPVVLDPSHELWSEYAVRAWPTVMVLDTTGRIAWQRSGEVDRHTLSATIARLLEEGKEDGTVGEPSWSAAAPTTPDLTALSYPEKLMVWPGPLVQAARKADPFGLHSRLYLADTGNHRVIELRLTRRQGAWPRAKVLRIFGTGTPGLTDGPAKSAQFHSPRGLARTQNTLWVADTENHAVRAIDLESGAVRTVVGNGERGEGSSTTPAPLTDTTLRSPWDLEAIVNGDGEPVIFIAMAGAHQIWLLFPSRNHIGPFVGSGVEEHIDGAPQEAALAQPSGLALAGDYLFFVDSETSSVRAYRMDERTLGTLVGKGLFDFGDVDGQGPTVRLQHPLGITLGESELYIADTYNNKIKTLQLSNGTTTTLAGGDPAELSQPAGLDRAGDFLIVADTNNSRIRAVHCRTGVMRDIPIVW